jgi:CBS domain containing-hemolysin-like protein
MTRRDEDGEEDTPTMTEEELKYMIEAIEEEGVLEEQESELVQSALDFDEITAQEILTPRVDVEALDITEEREAILKKVTELHYSRLPVYQDTVDNIRGVVRSRDILEAALQEGGRVDLPALMTPCMYIHKTMKISQLLRMFQKNKAHLAVVADDYGGTLGIVTMEDVLEQLVGEIWDETDEVEDAVTRLDSSTVEVAGDENIYDFFEEIDCSTRNFESDFNTVAGWATEQLERIPEEGDSFVWNNLKVTVTEMDEARIIRLRVEKLPEDAED